jgi:hypothetical protein
VERKHEGRCRGDSIELAFNLFRLLDRLRNSLGDIAGVEPD